jgi:hypothetical protein
LRRVGIAQIVIGAIDITYIIYSITHRTWYASSLNIFAVIAGFFLYGGNLRAASFVRSWATFFFACSAA